MPEPRHSAVTGKVRPEFEYKPWSSSYDEMTTADGQSRPHWRVFADQLQGIGLAELRQRWNDARHLIRENGVTYNVYGDPQGMDRPWELDPIPLLISPSDAVAIEAGLVQRATLLDRVLADLHGSQELLTSGVLPAELIFGHPKFLRPCHDLKVMGNRYLHLYAADVGRAPDGSFFVLADRTQAPSGAGYALENRIVLSRMLPETFRDCQVQRLALFFRTLRETLRSIAPHDRDNPRVVLLTPGPYNETYFEHAYLARYLGTMLVEGSDLTVRDNRVYLKLLGGLQPVDVILRRLDDDYCDPLELRRDSFLGVPGLVQAIRAGNVAMANALGSGLMESPAMLAYLPGLCRHILGEDLKIPSVPTWWCGEPHGLNHVLANLGRMVIKPTFGSGQFEPIFGEELTAEGCLAMAERIRARPEDYVGQEQLHLSSAPVLAGNDLSPRHLVIRNFLTASENGYVFMPGGLTRIAASEDTLVVSMQKGGGSKDTWVLSDGPVSNFSLLPTAAQPVELRRDGGDLPSRSADDLYWLGRHVERVESKVRLARGLLIRMTEQSSPVEVPELPALLHALSDRPEIPAPSALGEDATARLVAIEREIFSILFNENRLGSLAATIESLHRVAAKVRDRLSTDMWRLVNGLDLEDDFTREHGEPGDPEVMTLPMVRDHEARRRLGAMREIMDRKVISLAAFGGFVAESMTRGQGWRFLDMGRRLERSLRLIDLLRLLVKPGAIEASLLDALLLVADSSMTYRRRYMNQLQPAPVLDLLLADEANPRSVAYQLAALSDSIEQLPRNEFAPGRSEQQRVILTILTKLRIADVDQLVQVDETGHRAGLLELLDHLEGEIPVLNDALTRSYFSHLQMSRQFSKSEGEGARAEAP
jgi:uncharacterized circularly permuted ATP-grasp superfamily protein/uncharacterized alpha-E superfamily protein